MLPMMLKYVFIYECTESLVLVSLYVFHSHVQSELLHLVPLGGVPANARVQLVFPWGMVVLYNPAKGLSGEAFQHAFAQCFYAAHLAVL